MKLNVLVSGGGIAGLASAFWLHQRGAKVTVVERAKGYAPLGHYIALKAIGVQLIKQMGLYDACAARAVHAGHLKIFAQGGRMLREGEMEALGNVVDGYLMFKRAALHAELYEAVKNDVEVRFDAQLTALQPRDGTVEAVIGNRTEQYDLVLGADGIHSHVRELCFDGARLRPLGGHYIAMNINGPHSVGAGVYEVYLGDGQNVGLLPGSPTELTAMIYHSEGGLPLPATRAAGEMKKFLTQAYDAFPEHVQQAFASLNDDSFIYVDSITQVEMPNIVKGRIALLGDAAHCPTFLSGMGSSLALEGAHTLATSLERHGDDVEAALKDYQRAIAPVATSYQRNARLVAPLLLTRNRALSAVRNTVLRVLPKWAMASEAKRFYRANGVP